MSTSLRVKREVEASLFFYVKNLKKKEELIRLFSGHHKLLIIQQDIANWLLYSYRTRK